MIVLDNICLKVNDQSLIDRGNITIKNGFIHVILGESGSGKTTLLHEISLLSKNSYSTYLWDDRRIDLLKDNEKADIRRLEIGYIMQDLELISDKLTLKENIKCMCSLTHQNYNEELALRYMHELNLYMPLDEAVIKMSRGERQRFALVLALVKDAQMLICDEPTSALDEENAIEFVEKLKFVANTYNKMIIIATHDHLVSEQADCIYRIKDKQLLLEKDNRTNVKRSNESYHNYKTIHYQFYKVYKNGNCTVIKNMMNIVYILLMCLILLAPVILNLLLDKHEALYSTLATREIIVKKDYGHVFKTSEIKMLKEIKHVEDVYVYDEVNGYIDVNGEIKRVMIIPKVDIEQYSISATLANDITTQFDLNFMFDDSQYRTTVDHSIISAYPPKKHIDTEIVYIPTDLWNDILKHRGITSSHVILLYCDDINNINETINEVKRWLPETQVTSETMEYIKQIETLKSIKDYIVFVQIAVIGGVGAIAYISIYLENKMRIKEITNLRINGLKKDHFYLLYMYENIMLVLFIIILTYVGYFIICNIYHRPIVNQEIVFVFMQMISYLFITKTLSVFIIVRKIFKREVSTFLRGKF